MPARLEGLHVGLPPKYESEKDCTDACPPGSKGCTCHATPFGMKICVPVCQSDGDCPKLGGPPLKCIEGACAPPGPPPQD
ncbi:MAG: hypothetical protein HY744_01600 [Deltaproteobacteria bacterium]|nr:hypothetical protein [Deltaproteobacteria bacterium]